MDSSPSSVSAAAAFSCGQMTDYWSTAASVAAASGGHYGSLYPSGSSPAMSHWTQELIHCGKISENDYYNVNKVVHQTNYQSLAAACALAPSRMSKACGADDRAVHQSSAAPVDSLQSGGEDDDEDGVSQGGCYSYGGGVASDVYNSCIGRKSCQSPPSIDDVMGDDDEADGSIKSSSKYIIRLKICFQIEYFLF